jgi:hypothetical protein
LFCFTLASKPRVARSVRLFQPRDRLLLAQDMHYFCDTRSILRQAI